MQVSIRLKAFDEIYKISMLSHRSALKFPAKFVQQFVQTFSIFAILVILFESIPLLFAPILMNDFSESHDFFRKIDANISKFV